MLVWCRWAAHGCVSIILSTASSSCAAAATLLEAVCNGSGVAALTRIMCEQAELAEAAAEVIALALQLVCLRVWFVHHTFVCCPSDGMHECSCCVIYVLSRGSEGLSSAIQHIKQQLIHNGLSLSFDVSLLVLDF
jgi:hypothetical protein